MNSFQELDAWKNAHKVTLAIYRATSAFPKEERFGITSQVRRAASSIGANIAEGFGRRSTKDFIRYLEIANGSLEEVRNFLMLAHDLQYLKKETFASLRDECDTTGRLLGGLMKSLRKRLKS